MAEYCKSFLTHFSTALFFIRPVPAKEFPVVVGEDLIIDAVRKRSGKSSIILNAEHFNVLWIVANLTTHDRSGVIRKNNEPVIDYVKLRSVFFWHRTADIQSKNRLDYLLRNLFETGLIARITRKRKSYIHLTELGKREQAEHREQRAHYLQRFFELSELDAATRTAISEWFENVTPKLWQKIVAEASTLKIRGHSR